jgi:hypothetical protein
VAERSSFDANINVSVFETNIRIVGGLISAHLMARRAGVQLEQGKQLECSMVPGSLLHIFHLFITEPVQFFPLSEGLTINILGFYPGVWIFLWNMVVTSYYYS